MADTDRDTPMDDQPGKLPEPKEAEGGLENQAGAEEPVAATATNEEE